MILRTFLFLSFLASSLHAETTVNQPDEACMQKMVRACIASALPARICVVPMSNPQKTFADYGAKSPRLAGTIISLDVFHNEGTCLAPYEKVIGNPRPTCGPTRALGVAACSLNSNSLNGEQLAVFVSEEVFAKCSAAVRDLGLFGGNECLIPVSYPDGTFLETGLINALNQIADRISGLGQRDEGDQEVAK